MADDELIPENLPPQPDEDLNKQYAAIQQQISSLVADLNNEQIAQLEDVYYLWMCWGDFHLAITEPYFDEQLPPKIIPPDHNSTTKQDEFVYPIFDYGNRFSTSPGEELMVGSRATGKLLKTVEKIIRLAIARAKEKGGDVIVQDIRVSFLGIDIAQRKAFQVCMDAPENILVTNFDPGEWGERFFKSSKELLDRGYLPGPRRG